MRKLPLMLIAGAGALAACSLLQAPAPLPPPSPPADAGSQAQPGPPSLATLQRACLQTPGDPAVWQRLGERLMEQGDGERGARMLKQAQSLRAHTLADDYVAVRGMPRTELRALGPALLELRRVAQLAAPMASAVSATASAASVSAESAEPAAQATQAAAMRLEISNGNGVRGLAAAWRRTLLSDELNVIRLSNIRPFAEPSSRIEYTPSGEPQAQQLARRIGIQAIKADTTSRRGKPDLRLILGRDLRPQK